MTAPLARTLCRIHPERPAAARCPACGVFYCAECITEHDGRLTCASCLAGERRLIAAERQKGRRIVLMPAIQMLVGIIVVWLWWHGVARILLSIPADFHDGTIWK